MKIKSFSTIAVALLSSVAFVPLAQASPENSVLLAQQYNNAPQIDSFTVDRVNRLTPGSELTFTLEGTPNSRATLSIGNVARNIPMQEIEPGVYQGRYTIRSQDRLENTIVRANLQRGDRISSARLQQPLVSDGYANNNYPSDRNANNTYPSDRTNQSLYIESFSAQPVEQLEPGTELNFTLNGTPNARASFSIEGIASNQPMREVSPGTYTGEYVIRRQDNITNSVNATARLQSRGEVVSARLDRDLVASNGNDRYDNRSNDSTSQLPLEIISPEYNSRVRGNVQVRGRSAPNTTVNVNVRATNSLGGLVGLDRNIFTRSIQTDNSGYFSFDFQPDVVIPGTQYQVNLSASNGNRTNEETLVLFQQ